MLKNNKPLSSLRERFWNLKVGLSLEKGSHLKIIYNFTSVKSLVFRMLFLSDIGKSTDFVFCIYLGNGWIGQCYGSTCVRVFLGRWDWVD